MPRHQEGAVDPFIIGQYQHGTACRCIHDTKTFARVPHSKALMTNTNALESPQAKQRTGRRNQASSLAAALGKPISSTQANRRVCSWLPWLASGTRGIRNICNHKAWVILVGFGRSHWGHTLRQEAMSTAQCMHRQCVCGWADPNTLGSQYLDSS